jgi:hypothetical protein
VVDFGGRRNCSAPSMAHDAPRARWPVQLERENLMFRRLLADVELVGVGDGRGTPRDLGRAKFLIATQQVTAADPNS